MQPHLNTTIQHNPHLNQTSWHWVGICRCGSYYHAQNRRKLDTKLRSHYTRCTRLHVQFINNEWVWHHTPKTK